MFRIELYQVGVFTAYWNVRAQNWMKHPEKATHFASKEEADAERLYATQSGVKGLIEVRPVPI